MNLVSLALLSLAMATSGTDSEVDPRLLKRGCAQVKRAYPLLMLTVMLEEPVNCGTHTGEDVDCDANDTPEEAAKQAKRLEIRKRQESVFKQANEACDLYAAHPEVESVRRAAVAGLILAREVGTKLPKELLKAP